MTSFQTQALTEKFQAHPYLENEERYQLAKSLNISEKSIKAWFKNRRQRKKSEGWLYEGNPMLSKVESFCNVH